MLTGMGVGYRVERISSRQSFLEPELVLLNVLKGNVEIDYGGRKDKLSRGDLLLINVGIACSLSSPNEALIGKCEWSASVLTKVLKGKYAYFYCNTASEYSRHNRELKELLENLTAVYAEAAGTTDSLLYGYLFRILDLLIEHYQIKSKFRAEGNAGGSGKTDESRALDPDASVAGGVPDEAVMAQIMQYIQTNLHDKVSLTELADRMFVSTSTLSRIFKKNMGVYFADYVMQLRVSEASAILRDTDENLTQVALTLGFSSSSTFSRAFRKEMGESPAEYRERTRSEAAKNEEMLVREETAIREELLSSGRTAEDGTVHRLVALNLNDPAAGKLIKNWNKVINLGEVSDLTKANMQRHCLYLRDHLKFSYVRLWSVFSRNLMITDGRTHGRYNFSMLDQVLDFLLENRLKPFLDFGRRPSMAVNAEGRRVYYEETYTAFSTRELWEEAIREVIVHIRRKYGREEVRTWYLELSRDSVNGAEGERCYESDSFEFFDAWEYMYRTVQREIPGARVGGVAARLGDNIESVRDFYARCAKKKCVPAFCSFSYFPYVDDRMWEGWNKERKENIYQNGREASEAIRGGSRTSGETSENVSRTSREPSENVSRTSGETSENVSRTSGEISDIYLNRRDTSKVLKEARRMMAETGVGSAELIITDWNNTIANRDYLNDSCFRAAYFVSEAIRMRDQAEMVCAMTGSDWISYYLDTAAVVYGGIGLLTKDTIRKPAYFAFEFLGRLGGIVLSQGEDYILTRSAGGDYYLLCHYFVVPEEKSMAVEEGTEPDLALLHMEDKPSHELSFRLAGLPEQGNYYIKKRTLSASSGSVLDEWGNFQFAEELAADDIRYLRERCIPEIRMSRQFVGQTQELSFSVRMRPEDVVLLHIFRG